MVGIGGGRRDDMTLGDGSKIAVIGGGPSGTFFTIFALKMARMVDLDLDITIYDPKDFTKRGAAGCNRCGGVVSEILVQTLAVEGIKIPESVIHRGIDSYMLHTAQGDAFIATPDREKTLAAVYRGGGPKGLSSVDKGSFDQFLLDMAVRNGASYVREKIDSIGISGDRPVLHTGGGEEVRADLVVGAFGGNSPFTETFEKTGFGYRRPKFTRAAIAEVEYDEEVVREHFGSSIHLFLLPERGLKFAAIIPKGSFITVCVVGRDLTPDRVKGFLSHPVVARVLPGGTPEKTNCMCISNMNVVPAGFAFTDRIVACGDAGSTRLFKDGIGAAYLMGKAAARTAVFQGVSREDFAEFYEPVYREIHRDNLYGKVLFAFTDLFLKKYRFMSRAMLKVVETEQGREDPRRMVMSSILWGMFTGSDRYREIFYRSFDAGMHMDLTVKTMKSLLGV
jgi:flavin-dependent dehydrogenase